MSGPLFVMVSGPPGSGKSTLAAVLAAQLGLPLIAKDTIKDALMSELPVADVAASRVIGRAAVATMFAVAAESPIGAVIDCNLHRTVAVHDVGRLPGTVVEVFCRCDRAVAAARYRSRAGSRHPGHFDELRTDEELWNEDVTEPVAGGWAVVEVDTNVPVATGEVVSRILQSTP